MITKDSVGLVEAIIGAELAGDHDGSAYRDALPKGCVVTIARDYGSGGKEIAQQLAQRLGVRCFDREILDAIAADAKVDKYLMERLDEKMSRLLDEWAHTLVSGKNAFKDDYRRHLVNVVVGIARSGGVIVGRGAHLILHQRNVFRVRIGGSPDRCAERIARRRGIFIEQAMKLVEQVNRERADFIEKVFHHSRDDMSQYDIVLNSDRYDPTEIVGLIVQAMKVAGFPVPEPVAR